MNNLMTISPQDAATIDGGGCIPGFYGPGANDNPFICIFPKPTTGPYNPFPDDFID